MHSEFELAAGGLVHVLGKVAQVFDVKVVGRVGGGQVPLGLRHGGARRQHQTESREREIATLHVCSGKKFDVNVIGRQIDIMGVIT